MLVLVPESSYDKSDASLHYYLLKGTEWHQKCSEKLMWCWVRPGRKLRRWRKCLFWYSGTRTNIAICLVLTAEISPFSDVRRQSTLNHAQNYIAHAWTLQLLGNITYTAAALKPLRDWTARLIVWCFNLFLRTSSLYIKATKHWRNYQLKIWYID